MTSNFIRDHSVRARFVKDYSLPFNMVHDPYFDYFIDLFDEDFDTISALDSLNQLLQLCESVEDFFKKGESIKNEIIASISGTEQYSDFTSSNFDQFKIETPNPQSGKLYTPENSGKDFVSIDLVEANFNAMRFFSPQMFEQFGCPSYFVEVLQHVTFHMYFTRSKRFRQIIFGSLNPKRQRRIQKWWINKIIMRLQSEYLIGDCSDSIITISDDEVILRGGSLPTDMFSDLATWSKMPLHIQPFRLERIGDHPYYVKYDSEGRMEIKGVPSYLMPQVYKAVKGLDIYEEDRTFYFEGQLVRFVESFKK